MTLDLQRVAIIDEGDYWAIHGTEEELDELLRLACVGLIAETKE